MRIYNATIYDHEVEDTMDVVLAVLDTNKEKQLYDREDYDGLFKNLSYYGDDDVFYYINSSEIPAENNKEIRPGDKYDFFDIKTAELIASC